MRPPSGSSVRDRSLDGEESRNQSMVGAIRSLIELIHQQFTEGNPWKNRILLAVR